MSHDAPTSFGHRIKLQNPDPFAEAEALARSFRESRNGLPSMQDHINEMWDKLTRTHRDLFLGAAKDIKVLEAPEDVKEAAQEREETGKNTYYLYIDKENIERVRAELDAAKMHVAEGIATGRITEDVQGGDGSGILKGERTFESMRGESTDEIKKALPNIVVRNLSEYMQDGKLNLDAHEHGLLYLPHPYIVPGKRYDEMYNWDSAFVIRGLMQDGKFDLAKDIVDNMLYQIEHYGTVLNGTRTYYLDDKVPRSQPPILTAKILQIYNNYEHLGESMRGEDKVAWLERAAEAAEKYHEFWVKGAHLHEESGLSMYNTGHNRECTEVKHGEPHHYHKALQSLTEMYEEQKAKGYDWKRDKNRSLSGEELSDLSYRDRKDRYYIEQYLDLSDENRPQLTEQFYQGDWAMRESGQDVSRRFGFLSVDIVNHLPVDLNSLRAKMERELRMIYSELAEAYATKDGPDRKAEAIKAQEFQERAEYWNEEYDKTRTAMQEWLWDKGGVDNGRARRPAFRDRNVNNELCEKYDIPVFRDYPNAAMLFPMWAGVADDKQAADIVEYTLPRLRSEWGLKSSSPPQELLSDKKRLTAKDGVTERHTGLQWDDPILWAPFQVVAMEALEKYDYYHNALALAKNFMKLLVKTYDEGKLEMGEVKKGRLWEKYERIDGTPNTEQFIDQDFGYATNNEGFAWTNAAAGEAHRALERLHLKIHNPEALKNRKPEIMDNFNVALFVRRGETLRPPIDDQRAFELWSEPPQRMVA